MELPIVIVVLCLVLSCNARKLAVAKRDVITAEERPCNLAFKCSLQNDPTWTSDGKKCYVFRNPCILANENCQRQNRYEPVLENLSQKECQALCKPICPRMHSPICGFWGEKELEFTNKCMMDFHICNTGETYMINNEGPCKEA